MATSISRKARVGANAEFLRVEAEQELVPALVDHREQAPCAPSPSRGDDLAALGQRVGVPDRIREPGRDRHDQPHDEGGPRRE